MIDVNKIKRFVAKSLGFYLLLILIYNAPIFGFQLTKYLYVISFLYFIVFKKGFTSYQKKLLISGILLVCYGTSITLINGEGDFNMFNFSRLFSSLFSSVLIVDLFKYRSSFSEKTIIGWIAVVGTLESIIVLLAFFNSSFHEFLITLCGGNERYFEKLAGLATFRGIGWTYNQFSDFAVPQGMSFLCFVSAYIMCRNYLSVYKKILFYFILLSFMISGILIGRTFQLIIFIAFVYYCVIYKYNWSIKALSRNLLIFSVCSLGLLSIMFVLFKEKIPEQTINWAFELFKNIASSDKMSTASTDHLQTMWILPSSWDSILLGYGRFSPLDTTSHPTYSQSDVGIVNSIFYWGILGSIFYYLCIYLSFYYCWAEAKSRTIKWLAISLLLVILIYNIKGIGNGFAFSTLILQGITVSANSKPKMITNNLAY